MNHQNKSFSLKLSLPLILLASSSVAYALPASNDQGTPISALATDSSKVDGVIRPASNALNDRSNEKRSPDPIMWIPVVQAGYDLPRRPNTRVKRDGYVDFPPGFLPDRWVNRRSPEMREWPGELKRREEPSHTAPNGWDYNGWKRDLNARDSESDGEDVPGWDVEA